MSQKAVSLKQSFFYTILIKTNIYRITISIFQNYGIGDWGLFESFIIIVMQKYNKLKLQKKSDFPHKNFTETSPKTYQTLNQSAIVLELVTEHRPYLHESFHRPTPKSTESVFSVPSYVLRQDPIPHYVFWLHLSCLPAVSLGPFWPFLCCM